MCAQGDAREELWQFCESILEDYTACVQAMDTLVQLAIEACVAPKLTQGEKVTYNHYMLTCI